MLQVAVLEDEQESRVQIRRCLERYQAENHAEWDMDYFSSGAELLFSGASGYDMLLMDIEMPQMSGMEVARRVRREDQHVAIVFITNMANYALQGYEVEAMDFIVKPYTYEVFQFRMDRVVHRVERKKSNRAVLLTSNDRSIVSCCQNSCMWRWRSIRSFTIQNRAKLLCAVVCARRKRR